MRHASFLRKMIQVVSTPRMLLAYSRWLWYTKLRHTQPAVTCASGLIRGWGRFSDYWFFRGGIIPAHRKLIENTLRRSDFPKPVAFDIGAHFGLWTAELIGRGFATVHAFEPSPPTFSKLEENLRSCQSAGGHVMLSRLAIGHKTDQAKFEVEGDCLALSHLVLDGEQAQSRSAVVEEVPMTTIDSYCAQNCIGHIGFLKIDTEGYEPFVLQGASRMMRERRISVMVLECFPELLERAGTNTSELYRCLTSSGYEPRVLTEEGELGQVITEKQLANTPWADIIAVPGP